VGLSYWGWPGYYGGYYSPSYYGSYWYPNYSYSTDYAYPYYYGDTSPSYYGTEVPSGYYTSPSSNANSTARDDRTAKVDIRVPSPDAVVTIKGKSTRQTGTLRKFETTELPSGKSYKVVFRARWKDDNGRTVERSKTVTFNAGDLKTVDFTRSSDNEEIAEPENMDRVP
jgi:uncharacterized protein (TIGR03000 family)